MKINQLEKFLQTVASGRLAIGCTVTFTDPAASEIVADSGFDFCWIDGEHGSMDRNTAQLHMMALRGTDCASFYRVPACDHTEIKRIIDYAPAGIIVPMVMDADDAERAIAACRYPPRGNRGFGPRRSNCYGAIPGDEYLLLAEKEPLVIIQIEHIQAVKNLDRILAVPGLDAILVGPYDLSMSMHKPGQWDDPEVKAVLDGVCRQVRDHGNILLGAYAECNFADWKKRGVQFISVKNDTSAMQIGLEVMREQLHNA